MNAESLIEYRFGLIRDIMEQNALNPRVLPALSKKREALNACVPIDR